MTADLYFEVLRGKSHYYLDVAENSTIQEMKLMLSGITHMDTSVFELYKIEENGAKTLLQDAATFIDIGFNPSNAKAQAPAQLGLLVRTEETELNIVPVSTPPPIPDNMRQEPAQNE